MMNEYMVSYWDAVDYKNKTRYYLAESEDQLRSYIDEKVLAKEFRIKNDKDSLDIELLNESVDVPYRLSPLD